VTKTPTRALLVEDKEDAYILTRDLYWLGHGAGSTAGLGDLSWPISASVLIRAEQIVQCSESEGYLHGQVREPAPASGRRYFSAGTGRIAGRTGRSDHGADVARVALGREVLTGPARVSAGAAFFLAGQRSMREWGMGHAADARRSRGGCTP
jgi:hypothetical protein